MSGDIEGDTDAMRAFSKVLLDSLERDPVPAAVSRREMALPCPDGFGSPLCEALTSADNTSMQALQEFITQVTQGFEIYSSFVHRTAKAYVDADEQARAEFTALDPPPAARPER
ncbi:hypothetical protein H4696_002645 [Amycolatopsis lexingtonensis]|uniref:PE domain-containing protein n=1 Tax=Amycolatopsis lexingtonensis TaxID=218822 RepID=A0ABR9HXA6_9PSEU|nr:hypothetical protein [Amycolatopsis lexingtonensis]MBE1495545.1 hypothetical protein [Amycolatopsis lexingtonensis]